MYRRTWLCVLALVAAACEKSATVGAIFVDPSGAPVAGATVRFDCPGHGWGDGDQAQTDASGKLQHSRIPDIAATCKLTVEKPGFVPKTLLRTDIAYGDGMSAPGP